MKILFTGASSFTGSWFARSLAEAGHDVTATLTKGRGDYTGIQARRLEKIGACCRLVDHAPFGEPAFLQLLENSENFDCLCHHGAQVGDYRSSEFDVLGAVGANSREARAVLALLKARAGAGVVLTGSYFEPDEGNGDEASNAVSPYGLSKGLTHQIFRYEAARQELAYGKFVIPNPFGPGEERRLSAHLMRSWRAGGIAEIKTPAYVRDQIHVDLLARAYVKYCEKTGLAEGGATSLRPSGLVGSVGDFAQRYASEIRRRLDWACELKLAEQMDFSEPEARMNCEPASRWAPEWDENVAWDRLAEYYDKREDEA